jgi:hypothetical protein
MARCYQCGIQTSQYVEGSPVCTDCFKKLDWTANGKSVAELDKRLNEAWDEYRRVLSLPTRTFELTKSGGGMQISNDNAEIAAMKLRQALRDFVKALRKGNA